MMTRRSAIAGWFGTTGLAQEPDVLFRSKVRLVEIYATVTDRNRKPVEGLERSAFQVLDNGVDQEVVHFEANDTRMACALLIDTTESMKQALSGVKNAAADFIHELRPADTVAVYSFNRRLHRVQAFTTDHAVAQEGVFRTRASGGTALFDAISVLVGELSNQSGKKAIVVFTDGADNASVLRAPAAIQRAKRAGLPIYAVAQGQALNHQDLLRQLKEIARLTGGRLHEARKAKDIRKTFAEIAGDLRHMYFLAYTPPPSPIGTWREIKLLVDSREKLEIRAKEGYVSE